jgi:hypothetical protein
MAQVEYTLEELLEHYQGKGNRGPDGDVAFRDELSTDVLELTDESLRKETLSPDEADDLLAYFGWSLWDVLGTRVTEGESGLIPRQEYETLAAVEYVQNYPEIVEIITDAVGADGVVDIGGTARREIGTKVNALHAWCAGVSFATGRGILLGLGHCDTTYRAAEIQRALQFSRRLYRGLWGDEGQMFASSRGYRVPVLEGSPWLERFDAEAVRFDDPEQQAMYIKFNATTQLLTFLLHFDNRLGLGDSGPYPTEDGGFLIVRDHFLNEPAYHWFDVAAELPYAITQAMYFKPPPGMSVIVNDLSTTFTRPASYLPHLVGMAVYAREKWDTPMSDIRPVTEDEMRKLTTTAQAAMMKLYGRIAAMSRRDRIAAGVQNYMIDWALPYVRLAGVWDKAVAQGWYDWTPVTSECYYPLAQEGRAGELLPQVVIGGTGAVSLQAG